MARARELLIVTKANSRATVHRKTYLDYISIKQFDDAGEVTGEQRFLGLFTSGAYTESVMQDAGARRQDRAIFERTGFTPDSHSGKDMLEVLETYPRDELFQADAGELDDERDRRAAPAGAPQDQALPAPRRVRPVHVVPGLHPA